MESQDTSATEYTVRTPYGQTYTAGSLDEARQWMKEGRIPGDSVVYDPSVREWTSLAPPTKKLPLIILLPLILVGSCTVLGIMGMLEKTNQPVTAASVMSSEPTAVGLPSVPPLKLLYVSPPEPSGDTWEVEGALINNSGEPIHHLHVTYRWLLDGRLFAEGSALIDNPFKEAYGYIPPNGTVTFSAYVFDIPTLSETAKRLMLRDHNKFLIEAWIDGNRVAVAGAANN